MRKTLTLALAALTFSAAVAPAFAHDGRGGWGGDHDGWRGHGDGAGAGAAIAGGLFGLAIGAALAGGGHRNTDYHRSYYGPPPYEPYGYQDDVDEGYRVCVGRRTVWDPYWGHYVVRAFRYAC